MTRPEEEVVINERLLIILKNRSNTSNRDYRLMCSVCKVKFKVGDRVIRTNMAKYIHIGCYPSFRVDSDIEITDQELEDFFNIIEFMPSIKIKKQKKITKY